MHLIKSNTETAVVKSKNVFSAKKTPFFSLFGVFDGSSGIPGSFLRASPKSGGAAFFVIPSSPDGVRK